MGFFGKKKKNVEKEMPKKASTRVTIHYDVGYNNNLFIRGQGAGLSWEHGVMLKNMGPDEWVWETNDHFIECEFKVLINDQQFENGENRHVYEGSALKYTPNF